MVFRINPHLPNEPIHPYQLDESIPNLGVSGAFFYFDFIFDRISCKQTVQTLIRRRILSKLFALVPRKGR